MNLHLTSLLLLVGLTACGASTDDANPTGGKTNWLAPCEGNEDCAGLPGALCAGRRCTRRCADADDCTELGADVECLEAEDARGNEENVCLLRADSSSRDCDASFCGGAVDASIEPEPMMTLPFDASPSPEPAATEPDVSPSLDPSPPVTEPDAGLPAHPDSCLSPTQNVEEAYECTLEPCTCSEAFSEIACSLGGDGRWYAFRCRDGFWEPADNSRCATETNRCFSPTENVELALSGALPGCECTDDDFECARQGSLRVPMDCVEGRWRAMPDGPDCGGLFMDICAVGPDLCDGSDDIRLFTTTGGGAVDEYYYFYGLHGYSFLAIDGQCNYWVGSSPLGLVRTGMLSVERSLELALPLAFGNLDAFSQYQDEGCFDGGGMVLRDHSGEAACFCGCDSDAPPGLSDAFSTASALLSELFEQGADLTGSAQLLIVADETLEPGGPGVPWPLELDPLENLFEYDPSQGAEQVGPDIGLSISDPVDLERLRATRGAWLSTNEYMIYGSPYIHMTHVAEDAGVATHLRVFLRDDVPARVRAEFDAP